MKKFFQILSLTISLSTAFLSANIPLQPLSDQQKNLFDSSITSGQAHILLTRINFNDVPLSIQFSPTPISFPDVQLLPPVFHTIRKNDKIHLFDSSTTPNIDFQILDQNGNTLANYPNLITPKSPETLTPGTTHNLDATKEFTTKSYSPNGCTFLLSITINKKPLSNTENAEFLPFLLFSPENFPQNTQVYINTLTIELIKETLPTFQDYLNNTDPLNTTAI